MITHIVLLKPKSETTREEMQQVLAQVEALFHTVLKNSSTIRLNSSGFSMFGM